ncbi:MAG: NADH-quinone oxidoreductase subunit C [Candidatus Margulisiibacteriota bacterium]
MIEKLQEQFGNKIGEVWVKNSRRTFVSVISENIPEILGYMCLDLGGRFSTATALDNRASIEILYHVAFDKLSLVITLRTFIAKPECVIPTSALLVPATEWVEREIHEMFGVNFIGHPQLETLLLPDDWPQGVFPLRKKTFESEAENEMREN